MATAWIPSAGAHRLGGAGYGLHPSLSGGGLGAAGAVLGVRLMAQPWSASGLRWAVGDALREERQRQGLSQEAFGFEAELDRTYVSGVERGCPKSDPRDPAEVVPGSGHQAERDSAAG